MEHDLISIIIPVYNAGEYLYKCIESVIKQTYSRIEILLIDDGSTDNSAEICDSYAKEDVRVRVLHKKNAGVSSARNDGIRLANGMYLAFVDADDYISPEYITTLYNGITTFNVDLAAVGYNRVFVESDKNSEIELCSSPEVLTATKALDQAMDPVIPWVGFAWGKLIKKQVLLDNELEFDADIKLNEDSLFYYRFLDHANTVVKLPQIMYNYLIRADSVTRKATVDYKIQKTKVLAFERAFQIAQKYRNQDVGGGVFYQRIVATYFAINISYLSSKYRYGDYVLDEGKQIIKTLREIEDDVLNENVSKSTKFRWNLLKISPRLLWVEEKMHSFLKG